VLNANFLACWRRGHGGEANEHEQEFYPRIKIANSTLSCLAVEIVGKYPTVTWTEELYTRSADEYTVATQNLSQAR
jgi:hypothetical protein